MSSGAARRGRRCTALPCCCLLPPFWLTCTSTLLSLFSCAADATASERALPDDANPCAGLAALQARTGRRAAGERRLAIVNGAAAISLLGVTGIWEPSAGDCRKNQTCFGCRSLPVLALCFPGGRPWIHGSFYRSSQERGGRVGKGVEVSGELPRWPGTGECEGIELRDGGAACGVLHACRPLLNILVRSEPLRDDGISRFCAALSFVGLYPWRGIARSFITGRL